jgi:hypothetical protein
MFSNSNIFQFTFYFIILILEAFPMISGSSTYDSYLNVYKKNKFARNDYQEIANSTWKEFFVSENVTDLIKCIPFYIDDDKELDLFVLDAKSRLYWVSNIRGTSKEIMHKFISSSKLHDFVVSTKIDYQLSSNAGKFYLLGINSKRDKILKFDAYDLPLNNSIGWKETTFFDVNDENLMIKPLISNSEIITIHLYQFDAAKYNGNRRLLLLKLQNYYDYSMSLLKIIISDESIDDISLIRINNNIRIIGAYDMNNDGLIDILYIDDSNTLNVMVNDDPYYWYVTIANLHPITIQNIPRIFLIDADGDGYPDIVTADTISNTIGLIFNEGKEFWMDVGKFFANGSNRNTIYKKKIGSFIPLIDVYSEKLSDKKIKDFTVYQIADRRRINFEIFAIYEDKLYWFVEIDLNVPDSFEWGSHRTVQNYMYCMTKCEIVVEKQEVTDNLNYNMIFDIDMNSDRFPEFIVYSIEENSLFWIKKYTPYLTGFGWNSNFWIYIIIYIYLVSSVVGFYDFYNLKRLNDKMFRDKLIAEKSDGEYDNDHNSNRSNRINEININSVLHE